MFYLTLLVTNIAFIFLVKSVNRFWLLSIPLWLLILFSFIFWRMTADKRYEDLEARYLHTVGDKTYGDYHVWEELHQERVATIRHTQTFIYLISFQTLITWILQIAGKRRTNRKIYRYTMPVLGIFTLLIITLLVLMAIAPTGPLV
jgi:hypothetical protein